MANFITASAGTVGLAAAAAGPLAAVATTLVAWSAPCRPTSFRPRQRPAPWPAWSPQLLPWASA